MVRVKGGSFKMGSNYVEADEKPIHLVQVRDFWIAKHEVTVAQFAQFVKETGYQTSAEKAGFTYVWDGSGKKRYGINWRHDLAGNTRPKSEHQHPVIYVSWNDALAYCRWLNRKPGKKYRLPTEAVWEFAALGGNLGKEYALSASPGTYYCYASNSMK